MTEYAHSRLIRAELGPPGSELPSEAELVERFKVGRATIRQALATLEQEGLITTGRGRRRTVRDGRRWHWDMTAWEKAHSASADAWANTIRAQVGVPHSEVEVRIVKATAEVVAALDIPEGQAIVNRTRIRSVNGEPHQLSDSYFPKWLTDQAPLLSEPGDIASKRGLSPIPASLRPGSMTRSRPGCPPLRRPARYACHPVRHCWCTPASATARTVDRCATWSPAWPQTGSKFRTTWTPDAHRTA